MDKEIILADYTKTVDEIAEILGCSRVTISRWRKKHGIIGPTGSKKGVKKPWQVKRKTFTCQVCNKPFEDIPSKNRTHCSPACVVKNIDRSYMQTEAYRKTLEKETTPAYRRYRNRVTRLSDKTYQENKHVLNPHGYDRTICGIPGGYQLDHVKSVRECFDQGMTPEDASKLDNLQLLPWKTNLMKR